MTQLRYPRPPGVGLVVIALVLWTTAVAAEIVRGGGSRATDCICVFDAAGANLPAPPKEPRRVDCTDGDAACDSDGSRNGRCAIDVRVCLNSTAVAGCTPQETDSVVVDHALDNGDPRFDPDFQALQQRIDFLGLPDNDVADDCTVPSSMTLALRPTSSAKMRKSKKRIRLAAEGVAGGKSRRDRDRLKVICRPEGDGIYLPTDLYEGTFDRIRNQIFSTSCALSACHDSETAAGGLILLPNVAYSQLVGVTPTNGLAAADGLERIAPGDPERSFLYRKITHDLLSGYGEGMPLGEPMLPEDWIELIRLWILGDASSGPAPETGWVEGTED